MYPVLFTIKSIEIQSSPVFLALAILAGVVVSWREARRVGTQDREIAKFWAAVLPFAFFIGLVNGFLFRFGVPDALQNIFSVFSSGLISFGVIVGAFLLGLLFALFQKTPAGPILDLIALPFPLMLAIYRIGCFLTGCCYGLETNSFLGMYLPGYHGEWAYRYPTQLMLIIFNVILFAWLWSRRKNKPFEGSLTIAFLLVYSSGRILIDALRDLPRVFGSFSQQQLTSIAILLVTLYICFELWRAKQPRQH
ncbi:MAG: prolipoprotein diacylglyceryl transferase family protein [Chloroflexota bacterium]